MMTQQTTNHKHLSPSVVFDLSLQVDQVHSHFHCLLGVHTAKVFSVNMDASSQSSTGGYDLNWGEDPPSELLCLICLCVARDPHQHPGDSSNDCGKIFCQGCITKVKQDDNKCPNCCTENLKIFRDSRSKAIC